MHTQIANGETGDGPIVVAVVNDGDAMRLRRLTMQFSENHQLVEAMYRDIASLFPGFDPASPPKGPGIPTLSMTGHIEVQHGIKR